MSCKGEIQTWMVLGWDLKLDLWIPHLCSEDKSEV